LLIGKKNNYIRFIFQNIYFTAPAVNPFTIYFCAKNVSINAGTSETKEPAAISPYLTSYCCEKVAIEKIKHFVSKEAFNIDGFGKKIVENFWKIKLVRLPQDIFNLNFKKIESLDGWGAQSVNNLKYSINERKNISLE